MKRYKRTLAAALVIAVFCAVLFSSVFIVSRSGHDCHGHDCRICAFISVCRSTLDTLFSVLAVCVLSLAILCGCTFVFTQPRYRYSFHTLVNLKVKLSD